MSKIAHNLTDRQTDRRNYGVDLLRIIAMIGVVTNHLLTQGGALYVSNNDVQNAIIYLFVIVSYFAVNCYILISGYVNYSENEIKKGRYSKIVSLWLQVVFWGIILNILPGYFITGTISAKSIIMSIFPVTFQQYWFFTAYFGLFFVMPTLNHLCSTYSKSKLLKLIIVCTMLFSVYATFVSPLGDHFLLSRGFSFLWFCMLYVIGASMKKYDWMKYSKNSYLISLLALNIIITLFCSIFLGKLTHSLFGVSLGESILLSYNSPTILVGAVCIVALFIRLDFKHLRGIIRYWSSVTFGVYIIHMHPIIKNYLLMNNFEWLGYLNVLIMPFVIVGIAILITIVCLVLDKIREYIFCFLKVKKIGLLLENCIGRLFAKIMNKILRIDNEC